jgi:hypothetical protein
VLKTKTRLISVRITEDELCVYREICACEGFGSFSDLVRTAIQELIANRSGRGPGALHSAVNELRTRIDQLDHDLKDFFTPSTVDES